MLPPTFCVNLVHFDLCTSGRQAGGVQAGAFPLSLAGLSQLLPAHHSVWQGGVSLSLSLVHLPLPHHPPPHTHTHSHVLRSAHACLHFVSMTTGLCGGPAAHAGGDPAISELRRGPHSLSTAVGPLSARVGPPGFQTQ